MSPEHAVALLKAGLLAEMAAFAGIVLYRLLTGQIATAGLLTAETEDGRATPERVALLVTVAGALTAYAGSALHQASASHYMMTSLPEVPSSLVNIALGGSQGLFLLTKAARLLRSDKEG